MQLNKKPPVFLLVLAFIFSSIFFTGAPASSQAAGYEYINGYQEWTADKTISSIVVVNPGATLVIKNGITITFTTGGGMDVEGSLYVNGTVKNKIVFRKAEGASNYLIKIRLAGKLVMKNADVSGSGQGVWLGYVQAGIGVYGGWLDIQGSSFYDNNIPIYIDNQNLNRIRVNRTKFFNNSSYDVYYKGKSGSLVNFEYNWWGSSDGPPKICYAPGYCYYAKFEKVVDFSNWLTQENFKDPVIIIPGILGSWEKDGQLQIDPIFHTYDNLYAEFVNNGYTPEKDLFVFPYEWRDSNVENAKKLKIKIAEIKSSQNWPKVDIVAHSMGGLLAREYIESADYGNDVDQLISLATPNLGAPEAYIKWDGGDWFLSPVDIFMKHIIKQEAKEGGFSDAFDYIHNQMLSVKELLPVYSYLYDANDGNNLRIYPNNYPRNEFLENINNNFSRLNLVEYDKIIGNLQNNESTISGMNVVNANMGKYWVHGYPLGFEIPGDRGMRYSNGDETVPFDSAKSENVKSDIFMELTSDHQSIVTDAQKDVLELLTNVRPATEVRHSLIRDILIAQAFSPIDMQIIAPDGKRVGKDFATGNSFNEIEGAYYTGYNTDTEFLTIPDPQDGEYKILTQGTGNGEYKIEATKISEDEISGQAVESTGVIEGSATVGQLGEATIEIKGNEVSAGDKIPPTITINYPKENDQYLNNQILDIDYKVEDNKTASENIKKEMFLDGVAVSPLQIDLALEKLGGHKLKITAEDEAGNKSEKEVSFTVSANVNSIIDNVNHYSDLKFISDDKTKDFLLVKLSEISHIFEMLAKMENKTPPYDNQTKLLNKKVDDLIGFIQDKKTLNISDQIKELLIEGMESLKNN